MIGMGLIILLLALPLALLKRSAWFVGMVFVSSGVLLAGFGSILLGSGSETYTIYPFGWQIVIQPLSAWFGLIFSLGFPLGSLYAAACFRAHPGQGQRSHLLWLGIMFVSMYLVLFVKHILLFMLAWELMSLSSFLGMLYYRHKPEVQKEAIYYFVMMQIGAAILLFGFALLYRQTGSFTMPQSGIGNTAKWLLLAGFGFKAGFFPFYSWLPKAHPVAPSHLSGLMSGLMIKSGIFGVIYVLGAANWSPAELYILLAIACITAFNGVIHALAESHLKRSLAYSSIENIGIIGIALAFWLLGKQSGNEVLATWAFCGAMLHTLFHSLFKPLLFYLSGNVLQATGKLEIDSQGGLGKRMPQTALLFFAGMAAISALPFLNGFVSEFCIFGSIVMGFGRGNISLTLSSVAAGAMLAFVSALALIAFSKLYSITFSGSPRSREAENAIEVPFGMLLSPYILGVLCLICGLIAFLPLGMLKAVLQQYCLSQAALVSLSHSLGGIGIVLITLAVAFLVLYLLKRKITRLSYHHTWGCGYMKDNPKLQYTGSAYINPLAYFLKPLMHKNASAAKAEGYFPQKIDYSEEVRDFIDRGVIHNLCRYTEKFLSLFSGIHNGRTNNYITYLLLALLALLFWVLGLGK